MNFVMSCALVACLISAPFAAQDRQETVSFSVVGAVQVPGIYQSSRPLTLTKVIALAKGLTARSNRHAIEVLRAGKDPIIADLDPILTGARPDIQIQTGDVVNVPTRESSAKRLTHGRTYGLS
jgi:protein involved in polysaccharide export with SLBB domain